MGLPCAIAVLVIIVAALTLAPAVLTVASKFGLLDPKHKIASPRLAQGRYLGGSLAHPDRLRDLP